MNGETVKVILNKKLDINKFKTIKCNKVNNHNLTSCFFYHKKDDQRRSPNLINYCHILCKNIENCKNNQCSYSHNQYESFYHKMNYKKKLCINYLYKGNCNFGKYCSFAHTMDELNIKFIHKLKFDKCFFMFIYKTEFCFWGNIKHDKSLCVYAHNFQDFRRTYKFTLVKKVCKWWNVKENYLNYIDLCKNGYNCNFCHGYKEFDFHPKNYKLKICNNYKDKLFCNFGGICHFIHDENIEHNNNDNINNKFLIYYPKNNYSKGYGI